MDEKAEIVDREEEKEKEEEEEGMVFEMGTRSCGERARR